MLPAFDLSALSYAIQCKPECAEPRKNPPCQSTTARATLWPQGMSAKQGRDSHRDYFANYPVAALHEIGDAIAAVQTN